MTTAAPRVVIVDDNLPNIELARFILEGDGFAVRWATRAADALPTIAAFQPHLVLMDIQLPGEDGLSLTRRLRALPGGAGLRIVAFTAFAMKGDETRMRDAGCDGYLSKPIRVGEFAAQVRALLPTA
jgi:two-component system, cell cycle response regulator DivK